MIIIGFYESMAEPCTTQTFSANEDGRTETVNKSNYKHYLKIAITILRIFDNINIIFFSYEGDTEQK